VPDDSIPHEHETPRRRRAFQPIPRPHRLHEVDPFESDIRLDKATGHAPNQRTERAVAVPGHDLLLSWINEVVMDLRCFSSLCLKRDNR
jgi:hypothetical protein